MRDPASWAMVSVSAFFVAFLIWKVRLSALVRGPSSRSKRSSAPDAERARERFKAARRRAEQAGGDRAARADALREAALIALEGLKRPELAARLARRAARLAPESDEAVAAAVRTLRAAGRYPALEKLLWQELDAAAPGSERYARTFAALLELYEGPLRRRQQASALRKLRARAEGDGAGA
jgi:hypothetical protein